MNLIKKCLKIAFSSCALRSLFVFKPFVSSYTESLPEATPYFYYKHARLISEHGHLSAQDMDLWLPLGRDLNQTLPHE